jgi:predicted secreted Zn-dependent protease
MSAARKIGTVALAVGGAVLLRTPVGKAITAVTVATKVWQDPRVQKIRRQVAKKAAAKAAKKKR